jgi:hypothetical protein
MCPLASSCSYVDHSHCCSQSVRRSVCHERTHCLSHSAPPNHPVCGADLFTPNWVQTLIAGCALRCHDINGHAWFTAFAFNCSPRTCHKRVSHCESRERVRISFYFSSRLSLLRHQPVVLNTTRGPSTHAWNAVIGGWRWGGWRESLCRVWQMIYCFMFHISVALLQTLVNKCQ